jgi:uncharacterized membrane protein
MASLVLGTVFFVGIHLFVSGTRLRDWLTERIGEKPYLGLFSLASLGGISWMCAAYADAPAIILWEELPGAGALAVAGTLVAFVLVVLGLTTPSPTAAGGEALLDGGDPAIGILRVTRHPFLWGVAIWAAVHLLTNGDAASLVFFGGLLFLSLRGPSYIDAKRARKLGGQWEAFAARTSAVPFAAILGGRNHLALREIPIWKPVVAIVAWAGVLHAHGRLFGASPFAF